MRSMRPKPAQQDERCRPGADAFDAAQPGIGLVVGSRAQEGLVGCGQGGHHRAQILGPPLVADNFGPFARANPDQALQLRKSPVGVPIDIDTTAVRLDEGAGHMLLRYTCEYSTRQMGNNHQEMAHGAGKGVRGGRGDMSEADAIARSAAPCTRASLADDLQALGVAPGMTVLAHSSLSRLGWVCGGSVAVVQALTDALTPAGTLVMPTHSGDLSDPAGWQHPPVPEEWIPVIRETMPAYDPRLTPTRSMGRIVETFRTWPDVVRSAHPQLSFAAWGRQAEAILRGHTLDYGLGEDSPLARLYDLNGHVLLLGVGHDNNTSFHLAEYRAPGAREMRQGAPILVDGRRTWVAYREIELDEEPFATLGAAFEEAEGATGTVRCGRVGVAESRLFRQRAAVDFAVTWLHRSRTAS